MINMQGRMQISRLREVKNAESGVGYFEVNAVLYDILIQY